MHRFSWEKVPRQKKLKVVKQTILIVIVIIFKIKTIKNVFFVNINMILTKMEMKQQVLERDFGDSASQSFYQATFLEELLRRQSYKLQDKQS